MNPIDRLSDRDREILRAEVADKIEQLLPHTRMGLPWRESFEREAGRLSSLNGRVDRSDADSEKTDWALAHYFILKEV